MNSRQANALLLIVSLFISVGICELAARVLLYFNTPPGMLFNEDIIYTYQPYITINTPHTVEINNVGGIGDNVITEKEKNEVRIFLLGGSTSFDMLYPKTMKKILSAYYPERLINVTSFGRPRYTSYVNRVNFEKNLLKYCPDIIVLYMGINDVIYNVFPWVTTLPDVGYFNWRTTQESILIKLFNYHFIEKKVRSNPNFTSNEIRSGDIFKNNISRIIETAIKYNIKVILSSFSLSYPTEDPFLLAKIKSKEKEMQHFWGNINATVMAVNKHNEILQELALKYHLPLAKSAESIPKTSKHFNDICHFTDEGVDLLARNMSLAIISNNHIYSGRKATNTHDE